MRFYGREGQYAYCCLRNAGIFKSSPTFNANFFSKHLVEFIAFLSLQGKNNNLLISQLEEVKSRLFPMFSIFTT